MAATENIYGIHAVQHGLKNSPERCLQIFIQSGNRGAKLEQIQRLAESLDLACQLVPRKTLDKLADQQRHQGVVLQQRAAKTQDEGDLFKLIEAKNEILLLILDGVEDPHNLGACLRTADAAGADALIIPASRGVGLTPVVRKVACGAADSIPLIEVRNLARCLAQLKEQGVWLIGAADSCEQSLYEQDLTGSIGLIMGSEGKGIRRLTADHCDHLVRIPMAGAVESLNVSVASGICLYEAVRQRRS